MNPEVKRSQEAILRPIIDSLFEQKLKNGPPKYALPIYELKKIVDLHKHMCPFITIDVLKGRLKRKLSNYLKIPTPAPTKALSSSSAAATTPPCENIAAPPPPDNRVVPAS